MCHTFHEPVFITKNGWGDLSVMSIEAYEELSGRTELYCMLKEDLDDVAAERIHPLSEEMAEIRKAKSDTKNNSVSSI